MVGGWGGAPFMFDIVCTFLKCTPKSLVSVTHFCLLCLFCPIHMASVSCEFILIPVIAAKQLKMFVAITKSSLPFT